MTKSVCNLTSRRISIKDLEKSANRILTSSVVCSPTDLIAHMKVDRHKRQQFTNSDAKNYKNQKNCLIKQFKKRPAFLMYHSPPVDVAMFSEVLEEKGIDEYMRTYIPKTIAILPGANQVKDSVAAKIESKRLRALGPFKGSPSISHVSSKNTGHREISKSNSAYDAFLGFFEKNKNGDSHLQVHKKSKKTE